MHWSNIHQINGNGQCEATLTDNTVPEGDDGLRIRPRLVHHCDLHIMAASTQMDHNSSSTFQMVAHIKQSRISSFAEAQKKLKFAIVNPSEWMFALSGYKLSTEATAVICLPFSVADFISLTSND